MEQVDQRPLLYKYFDDTAGVLLAEYKRSSQQGASANIGKNREIFCSNFLEKVLPPKLSVRSGEIWDSENHKTGQLEIIILREDAPSLDVGSENIYLAEGVFAAVEIKSNLDRTKLQEAGRTLLKVKDLKINLGGAISIGKPMKEPLRMIFAYEGAAWETLTDEIVKNNWEDVFDLICVLNRGVLIKKGGFIDWHSEHNFFSINGKAAALGFMYQYLVTYGTNFLGRSLKLNSYFEPLNKWND